MSPNAQRHVPLATIFRNLMGELAALLAALMWTISSMLWGRIQLTAMTLNLCKNLVGLLFITAHLTLLWVLTGRTIFSAGAASWGWLATSGLVGILIGDGCYFRSLQILGPRKSLMIMTLSPFLAAVLGLVVLGESLTEVAIYGMVLTVSGVLFVVLDRKAKHESPGLMPGEVSAGILFGLLGALCQAGGGVLSRRGMRDPLTGDLTCDPIEAAFIRILVAAIGTSLLLHMSGDLKSAVSKAIRWPNLRMIVPATAMGTWLGIWLSQVAFRETQVAIAQTLLATCPLFAIPIVWFSFGHRVTLLSILGTVAGIAGIYLVVS